MYAPFRPAHQPFSSTMLAQSLRKVAVVQALLLLLSLVSLASAHGHHGHTGPADESVPIDSILWIHMLLQAFVWAILFPLTMVFGLTRSRLHVPLALTSLALTTGGYLLGHKHGGRRFPHTAHGTLASLLVFYLGAQTLLGLYLKLHLKFGGKWVRPSVVRLHGWLGVTFPIVGWTEMVFGIITLRSWCFGGRLGQCVAHHLMGSAFVAYGVIMLLSMKVGVLWLKRKGCSQEMIDGSVLTAWGLINAFTEHHGGPWSHKDLQHTLLGVVWVGGGLVSVWLARGGRRTVFPGILLIISGWAFGGHAQELMLSTMIHGLFGYTLMAAGVARIIEVAFLLADQPSGASGADVDPASLDLGHAAGETWFPIRAFQYLPPWLLFAAGILFMSATDEELRWADAQGVDHVTWGLIDFSLAFLLFFWANVLIDAYSSAGGRGGAARNAQLRASAGGANESGVYERLARVSRGDGARREEDEETDSFEMGTVDKEEPQHVLFDQEEGDEDADPFEDDHRRR